MMTRPIIFGKKLTEKIKIRLLSFPNPILGTASLKPFERGTGVLTVSFYGTVYNPKLKN